MNFVYIAVSYSSIELAFDWVDCWFGFPSSGSTTGWESG